MRRTLAIVRLSVAVILCGAALSLTFAQSAPSITSVTPNPAGVGMSVTISGSNFGSSGTVTFNGVTASTTSWGSTSIVTPVPSGSSTGNIVVTVGGQASNAFIFTVNNGPVSYSYDELGRLLGVVDSLGNAASYSYDAVGNMLSITRINPGQIAILSFSPPTGAVGSSVTINGTGFSATTSLDTVQFNGVSAPISSATATQIVTNVPSGATTGHVTVTSPLGTATSTSNFTVVGGSSAPTITSFAPTSGVAGTAVTVTGTNFDPTAGNDRVKLNLTNQAVSSATSTSIATNVPSDTGSGHISVATVSGTAVSSQDFYVPFGTHVASDIGFTNRILVGGSTTVSLGVASQIAIVLFDAAEGSRVNVQTTSSTLSPCSIYLFGPYGQQLVTNTCNGSSTTWASPVLPSTGTYSIGIATGSTGSLMLSVTDASDVLTTITPSGSPVTVTTTKVGQDARLVFTGTAGHRVSLVVSGVNNPLAYVYLIEPDGSIQGTALNIYTSSGTFFMDTQTLLVGGPYTLWVEHFGSNVGHETLQLYDASDVTTTITPGGSAVTVTTTAPGQDARLTFSGTAGQRVSLLVNSVTNPSAIVYLVKPDGTNQTSMSITSYGSSFFMDVQALATTGTYTLLVAHQSTYIGHETLQMYAVPTDITGSLTINGSSFTVTTTAPGQNGSLTFSGTSGQSVTVHCTSNTMSTVTVTLKNPSGSTLTSAGSSASSFNLSSTTLSTTGTYTIAIDPQLNNVGSITVNVTNP